MSGRGKKWATRIASGDPFHVHGSEAMAYRYVRSLAEQPKEIRVDHVTVFVDQRDGCGWKPFDKVNLREIQP